MDLTAIEPQKISKDLSSYTNLIYGNPKAGKSTFEFELYGQEAIFARTEKGSKLIAGLKGQDIGSWSDFMKFKKQLKRPEVKALYKVVVIDTVDNLWKYLEKYVKDKYTVDNIKDANGGYGAGFRELSEQFFLALQEIEMMGYTLAFISHATTKTEKLADGKTEVEKYIPSVDKRGLEVVTKMVDNILFAYIQIDPETQQEKRVLYTRETLYFQAGSRFKYINNVMPLSAAEYRKQCEASLEKEDPGSLKEEREANAVKTEMTEVTFEDLMAEAKELGFKLHGEGKMPKVTEIVEKIFGKGKLLKDAVPQQIELLKAAVDELKTVE